ncbi:MAG: hypothetical protein OER95_08485 [Acidimicrobiia bacterium]|nr:hypothetical protein [Acidimicrobiia bacterium]
MKLTFHIGAGKTGSSAVQRALAVAKHDLADQGILVAPANLEVGGNVGGQQVFAFQTIKQLEFSQSRQTFAARMQALIVDAGSRGGQHLIFSAENLSNPHPWSEVIGDSLAGHDVEVVVYIRRQDNYLLSAWQQWTLKRGIPFDSWLVEVVGIDGDWRIPIEEWEKVATGGRLTVRLYEPEHLVGGDVAQDFFSVCDLPTAPLGEPTVVNRSYGMAAEELAMASGNLFSDPHDSGFFDFLDRYCHGAHLRQANESRLTVAERQAILGRYRDSNNWIRERYFSGPEHKHIPPTLFTPPRAGDGRPPANDDLQRGQLAIVTELLYGLYRERLDSGADPHPVRMDDQQSTSEQNNGDRPGSDRR